jgi:hypothetical protein
MIRTLALIAGASFVLAVACLGGASALGAFDISHNGWKGNWNFHLDHHGHYVGWSHDDGDDKSDGDSTPATREIAWGGTDGFDIDVPADVQFTQASGPAKLVVTGPKDAIDHLTLSGSHLQFDDDGDYDGHITVALTAPAVRRFAINGDGSLSITGYDQDELDIDVSGHGDVSAKGKAKSTKVDISGDGNVDLGGLPSTDARADISGSGRASIAPTASADLHISGSGEIDLLTHPAKVTSDVSGSGRIVEGQTPAPAKPS